MKLYLLRGVGLILISLPVIAYLILKLMPNVNDSAMLSYAENEQVLNLLPIPIVILKSDLFIIDFANDAMFALWRRERSVPTLGLPLVAAFPETDSSFLSQLKQVFQTGVVYRDEEVSLTLNDGTGEAYSIFIDYTYQAIRREDGEITGILVTAQDVSHKVSAKQLLQDTTRQLKDSNHALASSNEECLMAIETAKLGTWKLSADRSVLSFSKRGAEIYGLAEDQILLGSALDLVREDYRASVQQMFKQVKDSGEMFELEYPIRPLHLNQDRWIRLTGRVMIADGQATMLKGTLMDITGQKMELIRKNEFIAMASHELKTPLTSLNGLVQLMSRRPELKENSSLVEMTTLALSQIRKMTRMINSFVNISRLEAGKFDLDVTDFDLGELVTEYLDEVRVSAPRHQFIQQGCQSLRVKADRVKIGVLLTNLVANAVKFTPAGKSITVSCFKQPGYVEVSVLDQGCGIAEKDRDKVFERFSQIENLHVKNSSGFGIGLFLCSEIIRRHQGEIWLEDSKGPGCDFHFRLPVMD
jgi:two-component system sensor histidine kinase VicK